MIIRGVTPTNDISYFTLSCIAARIKVNRKSLYNEVYRSKKYIAFSTKGAFEEVCMPIEAAWRLINDANSGKVLKRAIKNFKKKNKLKRMK